jgi:hypothetical protein
MIILFGMILLETMLLSVPLIQAIIIRNEESPIYVHALLKMQSSSHDMLWLPQTCCYLLNKMPML